MKSGIKEYDFWEMTISEVVRQADANNYIRKQEMIERAQLNYQLPQLIGLVISNMFSKSKTDYPEIYDLYPHLFNKEQFIAEKQKIETEKSVANFMKFAAMHNAKNKAKKEG